MERPPRETPRRPETGPRGKPGVAVGALAASLSRRLGAAALVLLALGIVGASFVLPVGALLVRSFQAQEVVLRDGRVLRAVADVRGEERVRFAVQAGPGGERVPQVFAREQVLEVRTVGSLQHYRFVLGDASTWGLLRNTVSVAAGAALAALLLGLPLAWLLARTDLPGRRTLGVLCLGPAILPPFFVAMGGARPLGRALYALLGIEGGTLQLVHAAVVFGLVLFPLVLLLVGRALAAVPAGPWEAAVLLGGRGPAFRRVVLPAVLPAVLGAAILVFVLAASDFAVPDLLGFMLPRGSATHVFPTEVLLQWKQLGNQGRAVATGAPLLLATVVMLFAALALLRRSPVTAGGEGGRARPPRALSRAGRWAAWGGVALLLFVALVVPLAGIARWGMGGGETAAQGSAAAAASVGRGALFDFASLTRDVPGIWEDCERWIRTAVSAALLAAAVSVVLVRWALRGGRRAAALVFVLGALPLALPGLVLTVGTKELWSGVPAGWTQGPLRKAIALMPSVLALTARFLPFALAASWLALREVRRGHEEAASLQGAGAVTRALRIWGPRVWPGVLGGALIVLVLSLREIEAVMLLENKILPLRLYDQVHFSRLATQANLALLYVGIVMLPAVGWLWFSTGGPARAGRAAAGLLLLGAIAAQEVLHARGGAAAGGRLRHHLALRGAALRRARRRADLERSRRRRQRSRDGLALLSASLLAAGLRLQARRLAPAPPPGRGRRGGG